MSLKKSLSNSRKDLSGSANISSPALIVFISILITLFMFIESPIILAAGGCNNWCLDNDHGEALYDQCMSIGSCVDGNLYPAELGDVCYNPAYSIQQGCCCRDIPNLTIVQPDAYIKENSLLLNANVIQTANVKRRLDSGNWVAVSGCSPCRGDFNFTLSSLSEGQHIVELESVNTDGLSDKKKVQWTVDTSPPELVEAGDTSGGKIQEGTDVNIFTKWRDNNLKNASIRIREGSNPMYIAKKKTFTGTSGWLNYTFSTSGKGGKTIYWDAVGEDKAGNIRVLSPERSFEVIFTVNLVMQNYWKMAQPGWDIDVDAFVSECGASSQVFYFTESDQLISVDSSVLSFDTFSNGGGVIFKAGKKGCSTFRYVPSIQPVTAFNHHWYIIYMQNNSFNIDELDSNCGVYSQIFYFHIGISDVLKAKNSGAISLDDIDISGGIIVKAQKVPCSSGN